MLIKKDIRVYQNWPPKSFNTFWEHKQKIIKKFNNSKYCDINHNKLLRDVKETLQSILKKLYISFSRSFLTSHKSANQNG